MYKAHERFRYCLLLKSSSEVLTICPTHCSSRMSSVVSSYSAFTPRLSRAQISYNTKSGGWRPDLQKPSRFLLINYQLPFLSRDRIKSELDCGYSQEEKERQVCQAIMNKNPRKDGEQIQGSKYQLGSGKEHFYGNFSVHHHLLKYFFKLCFISVPS